jgi:hypothetical protein
MTAFIESRVDRKSKLVNLGPVCGGRWATLKGRLLMRFSKTATAAAAIVCLAALGGCDRKSNASTESTSLDPAAPGELRVLAGEHGFTPNSLAIPKGAAGSMATVTFVRTTDETCATEVVFPELDLKKALPLRQAVAIDVPSDSPRTLTFQCGMGMYKGALLVK